MYCCLHLFEPLCLMVLNTENLSTANFKQLEADLSKFDLIDLDRLNETEDNKKWKTEGTIWLSILHFTVQRNRIIRK